MNHLINKKNTIKYKDRFAFWFIFSLILNGYATGISGLSIGSVVYIIITLIVLLNSFTDGILKVESKPFIFGIAISVTSLFGMMILYFSDFSVTLSVSSQIIGFAKFWLWVMMSSMVVLALYEKECFTKWMVRFSILLTIYLMLQCIAFYGAGIYLPNIFNVGFLKPYADGYADYEILRASSILRPGSLLSESSFYGNVILCTTALYLDKNIELLRGKRLFFIIFVSIGIILSGSTSAIILQGFIFLLYFRQIKVNLKIQILFIVCVAGIAFSIMWFNGFGDSSVGNSLEYAFSKFNYLDQSTRFGKSYGYLDLLPRNVFYIGAGIGNDFSLVKTITGKESVYFNSITSLIIQSGILGGILFFVFVFQIFREAKKYKCTVAIALLVVYVVKGFASGIYFSTYGILFSVIIIGQIIVERKQLCEKIESQ